MDSPFRDDMLTITARSAAHNGHIDVVDLLAREFHAHIGVECLVDAAQYGQDVMIDHLVEKYGVDPLPSIGASLFDPEQPVDALCEQVVFLPNTGGAHDIKAETDPFLMLYDSFESHGALAGCRANSESRLGPVEATAVDMLDGGW